MKQNESIKKDRFLPIYLSVVAVCLFGIVLWLVQLRAMMVAYEASMPQYAAQSVAELLEAGDYAPLYAALDPGTRQRESEAQFAAYMDQQIGGQAVTFAPLYSASAQEARYQLSAGDAPVAQLVLAPQEQADRFGNAHWALSRLENLGAGAEYIVLAQDESTVYVDDVALSEKDAVEVGIPTDADGHLPSKIHTPTLTRYAVTKHFAEPQIRVIDKNGQPQTLVETAERTFEAQLNYDKALKKSQKKRAVQIAKAYGQFTIGRMSKKQFLTFILGGTKPHEMIYQYDERWYIKNKSYKFKNVRAEQFYPYAKNCYSCVVSYDLELVAQNGKKQTYPTQLTLYLYKKGSFMIYDMVIGQGAPADA